jgi:nucleoside-triphosphatase THEP1
MTVSGFLAVRSSINKPGQDYDLILLDTNESIPLSSRKFDNGWPKTGNFYFNPEALKRGNGVLSNSQILNRDLIVVDEIGIFELEGKIWADAVSQLIEKNVGYMLWVVRNTLVEKVVRKWKLKNPIIIDIEKVSLPDAEKMLLAQF